MFTLTFATVSKVKSRLRSRKSLVVEGTTHQRQTASGHHSTTATPTMGGNKSHMDEMQGRNARVCIVVYIYTCMRICLRWCDCIHAYGYCIVSLFTADGGGSFGFCSMCGSLTPVVFLRINRRESRSRDVSNFRDNRTNDEKPFHAII